MNWETKGANGELITGAYRSIHRVINEFIVVAVFAATLFGCTSSSREVIPGVNRIGDMNVNVGPGWTTVPEASSTLSPSSRTWTYDGLANDQLILIPGVKNTDAIITGSDSQQALPVLAPDTQPDELSELAEFVISKVYGGNATVIAESTRMQGFGGQSGIVFDFHSTDAQSNEYRGIVGAFNYEAQLYVIMFIANNEQSLVDHREKVETIMENVTMYMRAMGTPG
jgi:hypothetical protein